MTSAAHPSNPYVGLKPFERQDSLYFFGRREQTAELLQRLHDTRFLSVVGSSGCGKSSLIRAGLIPALYGGFLIEERDRWRIAVTRPGDAPLRSLAAALCGPAGDGSPAAEDVAALREKLTEGHTRAAIEHLAPELGDDTNLLLLVDQFEEIFAFRGTEAEEQLAGLSPELRRERALCRAEAADYVDLVVDLAERAELPVYTVLTMRTDFLGDCDVFYGLPEAMNRGRYLVPRLTRQQLRQAVEGPAMLFGARIAPRLLDRLLNKLGDRSDRLPVLQHALLRTWDMWQQAGGEGPIDLDHYRQAGTLGDALSRHAEQALRDDDLEATARIFKCLTGTDASQRRIRRPAHLSELVAASQLGRPAVEAVLERFREGGRHFVFLSEGAEGDDPRVDISHESLIRQWSRLRDWVDGESDSREHFQDLVLRARRQKKGEAALLPGPELAIALDWREKARPTRAWARRYSRGEDDFDLAMSYLDLSRDEAEARRRRQRRHRNLLIAATLTVLVALTLLTLWALDKSLEAQDVGRVAAATSLARRDPTRAALILLEVERPRRTPAATELLHDVLRYPFYVSVHRGQEEPMELAAVSPDGTRVLTTAKDGTVRIWPADGKSSAPVEVAHRSPTKVTAAAFGPKGRRVVTGSEDGGVEWWDVQAGVPPEPRASHEGHDKSVTSVTYCSGCQDRHLVATTSGDGMARIWLLSEQPAQIEELTVLEGAKQVAFSPDGRRVVTTSRDGAARVWETESGTKLADLKGLEDVAVAAFSPDGTQVVTGSKDGPAWISDAETGDPRAELKGHDDASWAAFSPDGKRVATLLFSQDRGLNVRIGPAKTAGEPTDLYGTMVTRAHFSSDGRLIIVNGGTRVYLWTITADPDPETQSDSHTSTEKKELVLPMGRGESVVDVWLSSNATRVLKRSAAGKVHVWSSISRKSLGEIRGHQSPSPVLSARFSSDGKLVVTASADGTARVWDAASGEQEKELRPEERGLLFASFGSDPRRIVTGTYGQIQLWQASPEDAAWTENEFQLLSGAYSRPIPVPAENALLSPDGRRLAAWTPQGNRYVKSDDRRVWLWELDESGRQTAGPRRLQGHTSQINSAAFSPGSDLLVTASRDKTARLWMLAEPETPTTLEGHGRAVELAIFDLSGSKVLTTSRDGTARIWNRRGKEVAVLRGHSGAITFAAFSRDGERVVTASEDGTARVWAADDPDEGALVELRGHDGPVLAAAFDPETKRVTTLGKDGTARIWSLGDAPDPVVLAHPGVRDAAFSGDGEWLVTAARDGPVHVRTAGDVKEPRVLAGHPGRTIAVSARSDRFATVGFDGSVWEYSAADGRGRSLESPLLAQSASWSPDGERLLIVSGDTAETWPADGTGEVVKLAGRRPGGGRRGKLLAARFSSSGERVVTVSEDGTARIYPADGRGEPVLLRGHFQPQALVTVSFSPNGDRVVAGGEDGSVWLWPADGSERQAPLAFEGHEKSISSIAWSSDGGRLVTASEDRTARVWEAATGRELTVLPHHEAVAAAAFAAGERVATTSTDGTRSLWDAASPRLLAVFQGPLSWTDASYSGTGASYSSDGAWVVTTRGGTARIWPADEKGKTVRLRGHSESVNSGRFSPDGTRVLTASDDRTARIWDRRTGEELASFSHGGIVLAAALSPDGTRVVTVTGHDETARIWQVDMDEAVELRGNARSASFSPDGNQIVTGSRDGKVRIYRADGSNREDPIVLEARVSAVSGAWLSPDGSRVATIGSGDTTAWIWPADPSGEPTVLEGHRDPITAVRFSPRGDRVMTFSNDGSARIWAADGSDKKNPIVLAPLVSLPITNASWSPDGTRVLTTNEKEAVTLVWRADGRGEPVALPGDGFPIRTAAFSPDPDGSRVLTVDLSGTVRIHPAGGGAEPVVVGAEKESIRSASFDPDGSRVLTVDESGVVRIHPADGGAEPVALSAEGGVVLSASFSADGRLLTILRGGFLAVWPSDGTGEPVVLGGKLGRATAASFSADGERLTTWSFRGKRVWQLDGSGSTFEKRRGASAEGKIRAVFFSRDGTRMATDTAPGSVRVSDPNAAAEPVLLGSHRRSVLHVAFSPDGKRVVTSSGDNTARIWNAVSGEELARLEGHGRDVWAASFSPDGTRVVTASADKTARIWDAESGTEIVRLAGHTEEVTQAHFSPDGTQVITVSEDDTARVWSLTGERLQAAVRKATPLCLDPETRHELLGESREDARRAFERCEREISSPTK